MADDPDYNRRTIEPHDRLTRLCAVMTDALDNDPETTDDVKCIVFLQDGDRGGIPSSNGDALTDTDAGW